MLSFAKNKKFGFTIIEVVIVIAILVILLSISVAGFLSFLKGADLSNASKEAASALRLAQSKTFGSRDDSQYGVYFDSVVSPNKYVIFKGADYQSREVSADEIFFLPDKVEFYAIDFAGGNEVAFNKLTGSADDHGSISLRLKNNVLENKTIYVSSSGVIGFALPPDAEDTRLKDSRHAHVDYSRAINTASENIILTFNSNVIKEIPISENLSGSEFFWEGSTDVNGSVQEIKIHTHLLNSPASQFCIHRDRRYNNKSLKVTISGDATGSVIEYSADGASTDIFSAYSSNLSWQ